MRILWVCLALLAASTAQASEARATNPPPDALPESAAPDVAVPSLEPGPDCDPTAWTEQLEGVRSQVRLIQLLGTYSRFDGVSVPLPRSVGQLTLPEPMMQRGVEVRIKEIRFHSLGISTEDEPRWLDNRPVIVGTIRFSKITVDFTLKTQQGALPVGCTFRNGRFPVDFLLSDEGHTLNVIPPYRDQEAQLDNVAIDVGRGPAAGLASRLAGRGLARLVLQFAAGQTLSLDQGAMLGGGGGGGSTGALGTILEGLLR